MTSIISYFLKNSRLNYTLTAFLVIAGIYSYNVIPKETVTNIDLNKIQITGSYPGASPSSLNGFAVSEIEEEMGSIDDIKEINSVIKKGRFTITADLNDDVKPIEVLSDIKNAVDAAKDSFPSDMTEPSTTIVARNKPLTDIAISSKNISTQQLIKLAKEIKPKILRIDGISEIDIYGDADLRINIDLNTQKIKALGLDASSVTKAIANLSYIFPVGEIDQKGSHIYLNAKRDKTDIEEWKNTLFSVDGYKLYLKDIASIRVHYPQDETISRFNQNASITLKIYKDEKANSLFLMQQLKEKIKDYEKDYDGLHIDVAKDDSKAVKDRLDTVISNLSFGMLLVAVAMYILISPRISLVVFMGIPFSFIVGVILMNYLGLSINMISMLAILISIGIVVDDAIVVSENIQRHISEGMDVKKASYVGVKEVVMPITVAAFTTMFAFLPMLNMSGELGNFIYLIPVVLIILIAASLIESFLFLPLHARHILKAKDDMLDWTPLFNIYENILHKVIKHKKKFLATFFVVVPLLTFVVIKSSHFNFMPRLDGNEVEVSLVMPESYSLEETNKIAKHIEEIIVKNKDILFYKNLDTVVGQSENISGTRSTQENGMLITLELQDYKEDNFIQNYLNPIFTFSFDFAQKNKTRTIKSFEVQERLRKLLKPYVQEINANKFYVLGFRIGMVKSDIEIELSSNNREKIIASVQKFESALLNIEGVEDISDNADLGKDEYRYEVNDYGASLGFSDASLANILSAYFMEKKQGKTITNDGIVEIYTQSVLKDNIDELLNFSVPVGDGTFVKFKEIVELEKFKDFEKIERKNLNILKTVSANVDNSKITATEVISKLQNITNEIIKDGVDVNFAGEKEQNEQLFSDISKAGVVAIFLIFMTLLVNFPTYKTAFMILSVIPFTMLGAVVGHKIMGVNLAMPSIIGLLGLAGVVINDGIIMLDFLHGTQNLKEFYKRAKQRVRPILITSITTLLGLSTLIFYPSGQGVMLQPLAISLGFGLLWGTILNLIYIPALYAVLHDMNEKDTK